MDSERREVKVLVSADCRGLLQSLMGKVQQLQLKNQFDFILLTGEVCNPKAAHYIASLRNDTRRLPLPAYFIDSSQMAPVLHRLHPQGVEIAPHLKFLGAFGVTSIGQTVVAYFSHNSWESSPPNYQEFLELCKGKKVDILLTNAWSKEVKDVAGRKDERTENYVSKLAAAINPHYHIAAGSSEFYRMPPYINSLGLQTHFISVAPYEEPPKGKYLFGLTLKPGHEELPSATTNIIENPYPAIEKQTQEPTFPSSNFAIRKEDNSESVVFFEGFPEWSRSSDITEFLERWGELKSIEVSRELQKGCKCGVARFRSADSTASCLASSMKVLFHTKRIKFSRRTLRESKRVEDCWFCKSGGDRSLIVYQGQYCYLSLEKGPLTRYHLQLIPYNHVETTTRLDPNERQELTHIVQVVSKHYEQEGKAVVIYQRYLPLSEAINHAVTHIVPVDDRQFLLKQFQELNQRDGLGFKLQREEMRRSQYFIRAELCGKIFLKQVGKKERVQADFMRIVLSQLLGNARLANWKQCVREEEEIRAVRGEVVAVLKEVGLINEQSG